jgi:hypothetical protein
MGPSSGGDFSSRNTSDIHRGLECRPPVVPIVARIGVLRVPPHFVPSANGGLGVHEPVHRLMSEDAVAPHEGCRHPRQIAS